MHVGGEREVEVGKEGERGVGWGWEGKERGGGERRGDRMGERSGKGSVRDSVEGEIGKRKCVRRRL